MLREQVNRNSRNSSSPPSSDGPEPPIKSRRRAKNQRRRWAQPGHQGQTRKPAPPEQVKDTYDVKPETCHQCGHVLQGQDPAPRRHRVTETPPVAAEIVEYPVHALSCSEYGTATRAELLLGVPQDCFGPDLQAMVSLLTGRHRLSKRDAEEILGDFFHHVDICTGSICALERRTS